MHDSDPLGDAYPVTDLAVPPSPAATGCRRFAAGVCTFLFAATLAATLFPCEAARRFLTSGPYLAAFDRARVHERLPALLAERIVAEGQESAAVALDVPAAGDDPGRNRPAASTASRLTVADWEAVLSYLLPPDDLRTQIAGIVGQLFRKLEYRDAGDSVTVSLVDVRRRAADPACVDLALRILESKNECTPQELRSFLAGGAQDAIPVCRPPPAHREACRRRLARELADAARDMPDVVDLAQGSALRDILSDRARRTPADEPEAAERVPRDPRPEFRMLRAAVLAPLLSLPWLALVVAFGVRSRRDAFRWIGAAFATTGLFGLVEAAVVAALSHWTWTTWIEPDAAKELGTGVAGLLSDVARSLVGSFVAGVAIAAAVVGGIGLSLVFAAPRQTLQEDRHDPFRPTNPAT